MVHEDNAFTEIEGEKVAKPKKTTISLMEFIDKMESKIHELQTIVEWQTNICVKAHDRIDDLEYKLNMSGDSRK